jgi:hypothetical protein
MNTVLIYSIFHYGEYVCQGSLPDAAEADSCCAFRVAIIGAIQRHTAARKALYAAASRNAGLPDAPMLRNIQDFAKS